MTVSKAFVMACNTATLWRFCNGNEYRAIPILASWGLISVPPHNHHSMQISLEKTAFSPSPSVLCRLLMVLPSSLCCLTLIVESSLSSHLGIQVARCMRVIPLSLPLPSLPPCCLSCHPPVRICLPRSLKVDKASKCWRCTTTL